MWIAKIKHERGEFEAETREQLIDKIVAWYGCDEHEWQLPDVEWLENEGIGDIPYIITFIGDLEIAMRHAKKSYDCIDPVEQRTHSL